MRCDPSYTRRPRSSMNKMITARIKTIVPIPMYMVRSPFVVTSGLIRRS